MYRKIADAPNFYTGKIEPVNGVQRISDNAFIPLDPLNSDYQDYLRWVGAGNQPQEAAKQ